MKIFLSSMLRSPLRVPWVRVERRCRRHLPSRWYLSQPCRRRVPQRMLRPRYLILSTRLTT
ncbi:hypothetical protein HanPSC8_Chr01g0040101 [Helianthus annuus]|nr:hypothetical protein HanPSC8_Chr01g0040101 [Helianthus annuus]